MAKAEAVLGRYRLQVTGIAGPLFKEDWPGAPRFAFSPRNDSFRASFDLQQQQQEELLERSISLAKNLSSG